MRLLDYFLCYSGREEDSGNSGFLFYGLVFLCAAAASVAHLPGERSGAATPGEQWPRPCVARPPSGVRGAPPAGALQVRASPVSEVAAGQGGFLFLFLLFFINTVRGDVAGEALIMTREFPSR